MFPCSSSHSAESNSSFVLPKQAHQPQRYPFPKRSFGIKRVVERSFRPLWFAKWDWLHYVEDKDVVLCFTCARANNEKKLQWSANTADLAFISKGFSNWKDATVKFGMHASSKCHKEAIMKMVTLPATTTDIAESLSVQHKQEKLERRQCFLKVLSNIRFLARQGLPLRGHGDESDSNFIQLMKLRGQDDSRIASWLQKKTDKYTAPDMQNEIIKVMAMQTLRKIATLLQSAPFLSVMVDETTDVANQEQVVICFRWVDSKLEAHEEFVGLYQVECTQAEMLVAVVHDVLKRPNISTLKLRGQCYDGASSMRGSQSGVATQILKEEPRAVYTHCYGHALNLACSDAVKGCKVMRDALDITYEIVKLIKKSPRRDATLQRLKEQMHEDSPGIRVLCPTRWTVRAQALQSILSNYSVLQVLWQESLDFVKEAEMRSRIQGVSTCMKTFEFFWGVALGELLLNHTDNLSKTLQHTSMSAAEGQKIAKMTVCTLHSIRSDPNFELFWQKVTKLAAELDVDEPALPRQRKRPRRYEDGTGEAHFSENVKDFFRHIYFEALDLVISGINSRFDQPGYNIYSKLEDLLVKATNNEEYEDEYQFIIDFYKDDFDSNLLRTQLGVMSCNIPCDSVPHNLVAILCYLRGLSDSQRALMSEVCKLVSLLLVMPATNATSERSFSCLRRVKSYLRSTMTQTRLNNVMVLHVYKDLTDELNLIDIGNEFVKGSAHREIVLGTFLATD